MKKIVLSVFLVLLCINLYAAQKTKLPKASHVSVELINTVENTPENQLKFNEEKYPRISKDKILINRINFISNNEIIFSIDNMDINSLQKNTDSNIYLCKQYENITEDYKKSTLFLFDFSSGKLLTISKDIHNYKLSEDGKKVYFVHNYDYLKQSEIIFSIWSKNKTKDILIDYKKYINELCDSVFVKIEKDSIELSFHQDAPILLKIFLDFDGNILSSSCPE